MGLEVIMSSIVALNYPDLSFDLFKRHLDDMDLTDKLRNTDKIIIKPNLSGGSYLSEFSAAITPRELVEKIISYVARISPRSNFLNWSVPLWS